MVSNANRQSPFGRRAFMWTGIGTGTAALIVYGLTCFRTVTWWDSLNYTTSAVCLGVPQPPGSLVAVLLGWIVTRFAPTGAESFALNLFAALLAAITVGLIASIGLHLNSNGGNPDSPSRSIRYLPPAGAIVGALTVAFSDTLWLHATKFTPYIFTACLTAILLWLLIRWWQEADSPSAWRRLLFVLFLFGIDFSIHRTNLLLLPGALAWILLRQPRLLLNIRFWLLGCLALMAGLSFHFLLIPIAAAHPAMNFNDPSTLARFWDYVSLKQYGGGFLLGLYPRKTPFWQYQIVDYLKVFETNFCKTSGTGSLLGLLPLLFGCLGLVSLWRSSWKLALGMITLFLCASLGAVVYFNIPADFFRPFDRHYLPSFVLFGVWTSYGLSLTLGRLGRVLKNSSVGAYSAAAFALMLLPGIQLTRNWEGHDGSRNFIAYDFGRNVLATLPPESILFTYGDGDTFPLWYLQKVEHLRPDVTVINLWLLNTPWFVRQVVAEDTALPLKLSDAQIEQIGPRKWSDTTIRVAVAGKEADTARFHIPPTIQNAYLMPHDWLIAQMITENRFQRPLYFSSSGGSNISPWIAAHLRPDGLAQRLMPDSSPSTDLAIVRHNLLDAYGYRGWSDSTLTLDNASMGIAPVYWQTFARYLQDERQLGDSAEYRSDKARLKELIPPSRCPTLPPQLREWLDSTD
jgi:hypothetical protein